MIQHFLLPELIDCDIGELAQCKITVSDWLNTLLAYLFIYSFLYLIWMHIVYIHHLQD